jgi:putative membrane-bound dehydrogenase-like protein
MAIALLVTLSVASVQARDLNVLFLGDSGHHVPPQRYAQLAPVMADRGIKMTYTDKMSEITAENLANFDALVLYANIDNIEDAPAKAILDYVANGRGFVPLHCATYCFRNNADIVALMGAQFQRHGTGVFRTQIADGKHPVMQNFGGFESWDETYVHHLHNDKNRTILEYRVDAEGREPWTWVRTHEKGRVFYTAWGHDHRTWGSLGFQNLVERGIRWAAGDDPTLVPAYLEEAAFPIPEMTKITTDNIKPFEYEDVGKNIPNYRPGQRGGGQGEPLSQMQKPLEPAESIKHIVTPVGFRAELFVSEPELGGKPIAMTWDERGRLWVCETYDYPNELQPVGEGRDRIRICEDTDHDGKADKFTVFAEKLSIPTSMIFHRGGVIVQNGVETIYLRDNDGDDVADQRDVMFSGWALGDTHGGVSNFQYGLDNWIWAMQGYNDSQPTVQGSRGQRFRQGFFRFKPDGSQLEFLRSTNNNTWGLGLSEEGIVFGSTANHNPSVYMPIPNRYYESVRGWTASLMLGTIADTHLFQPITDKVRQVDQHGGYTAGAGHALYTARRYPQEYWNRVAFVNGPTGHLVGAFVISKQGADYKSTSPFNLFASDDEWTAPIMAEVGPDGNVWVIDWYNYIVQHNPTPQGFDTGRGNAYETNLRDKTHGRIYRVVYGDEPADTLRTLAGATPDQLVAALSHPTQLWRKHAQRLLVERGNQDVVPQLVALVQNTELDAVGLNVGSIHALWTLHGLGALNGENATATQAALAALKHPSAGVRRNALQVVPRTTDGLQSVLAADLLTDTDAQVRLAAFLALAEMPAQAEAGQAVIAAMQRAENSGDAWIPDAATVAAARHDRHALAALARVTEPSDPLLRIADIVAEHYARGEPVDSVTEVIASLATAAPPIAATVLEGIAQGWPSDKAPAMTDGLESSLESLVDKLPANSRGTLVRLASLWGSKKLEKMAQEVSEALLSAAGDESLESEKRVDAARQLVEFRGKDDEVVANLLDLITPQTQPEVAVGIVRSLQTSDAASIGTAMLERLDAMTPAVRQSALSVLLARPDSTRALLQGIEAGTVRLDELTLDQKQALSVHPNREIRNLARSVLAQGGMLPDADRQKVLDEWMPITRDKGDVAAGKLVFTKNCSKCHRHGTEGANIGPDLTGMAVHPKEELIVHILDPSRSVEGNFRVYTLETSDGEIITGMLASESRTSVELIDSEGNRKTILREDIDALNMSRKSIMPEGFEKQVTKADLTNLLEFLTTRGKYVPLDLRKVATIASDRGMFNDRESPVERLVFRQWGQQEFEGVPFQVLDPQDGRVANAILLHSDIAAIPASMPKQVALPCNTSAKALHLLSGVSGWGYPATPEGSISLIVRIKYANGETEDHELVNGVHFADYIRRVDVPESKYAFRLRGQQLRYLKVTPKSDQPIQSLELIKGADRTAPIVMAITVETTEGEAGHAAPEQAAQAQVGAAQ